MLQGSLRVHHATCWKCVNMLTCGKTILDSIMSADAQNGWQIQMLAIGYTEVHAELITHVLKHPKRPPIATQASA